MVNNHMMKIDEWYDLIWYGPYDTNNMINTYTDW